MSGRPVARLVSPVLARVGVMAVLMAVVAIGGLVLSGATVDELDHRLQPAAAANQDVYSDLTSMSAAVEAWSSIGKRASADSYEQASLRLAAHEQAVREYAKGNRRLEALVEQQESAAHAWIDQYAVPRMSSAGGTAASAKEARTGTARFADIREAHQATTDEFDARVRGASDAVGWRLKGTALAVLAAALIGWLVVAQSRRRLMSELSQPLLDLEKVVVRMARNEADVRAQLQGPKEVQAVAQALNDLADAQARAKAVEVWIQRELRTLDTAKDDFVSNVSHELRTPLTTISGYLELVAEEFESTMEPRHERMLEATRRNVARLKQLIDDLLTLSQAEARSDQKENVDLVALVREVVTDVKITAARRGIDVSVSAPALPVGVFADRAMLHRAFLNVVSNAVKFSHDDSGVEVEIRSDQQGAGREVEVAVTDHGIGIPSAEIDRLGTRFFRASNAVTNEIAGTGLGVRMMQTIVDKHAGTVVFTSEEGAGTTVTVRIPQLPAGALPAVAPIPAPIQIPRSVPSQARPAVEPPAALGSPVAVPTQVAVAPVAPAGPAVSSVEQAVDELPKIVPAFARKPRS